jgi:hypothetical protein
VRADDLADYLACDMGVLAPATRLTDIAVPTRRGRGAPDTSNTEGSLH